MIPFSKIAKYLQQTGGDALTMLRHTVLVTAALGQYGNFIQDSDGNISYSVTKQLGYKSKNKAGEYDPLTKADIQTVYVLHCNQYNGASYDTNILAQTWPENVIKPDDWFTNPNPYINTLTLDFISSSSSGSSSSSSDVGDSVEQYLQPSSTTNDGHDSSSSSISPSMDNATPNSDILSSSSSSAASHPVDPCLELNSNTNNVPDSSSNVGALSHSDNSISVSPHTEVVTNNQGSHSTLSINAPGYPYYCYNYSSDNPWSFWNSGPFIELFKLAGAHFSGEHSGPGNI